MSHSNIRSQVPNYIGWDYLKEKRNIDILTPLKNTNVG